jgi:hypothetical protein
LPKWLVGGRCPRLRWLRPLAWERGYDGPSARCDRPRPERLLHSSRRATPSEQRSQTKYFALTGQSIECAREHFGLPRQGEGNLGWLVRGRCPRLRWLRPLAWESGYDGPSARCGRPRPERLLHSSRRATPSERRTQTKYFAPTGQSIECAREHFGLPCQGEGDLGWLVRGRCPRLLWTLPFRLVLLPKDAPGGDSFAS